MLSKNFAASRADIHPVPAAVTAWRYILSCTSPHANTPGILVWVLLGFVIMYPSESSSTWFAKIEVFGLCPIAINMPSISIWVISLFIMFFNFAPVTDLGDSVPRTSSRAVFQSIFTLGCLNNLSWRIFSALNCLDDELKLLHLHDE